MLVEEIINPRYSHHILITRTQAKESTSDVKSDGGIDDLFSDITDDKSEPTSETVVLYDGPGRSYTNTTTTGGTDVEMNKREISIPMRFDKWDKDKWPLDGDSVEIRMNNVVERGTVKDFEPDNNRSVIYWELLRV